MKIRLRYNKERKGEDDAWRVFVSEGETFCSNCGVTRGEPNDLYESCDHSWVTRDREHNVKDFVILVRCQSSTTFERGEMKWNVCCDGHLEITDGRALITCPRCPDCQTELSTAGGHGEWCPNENCKWGWDYR
jgi:hypothetical protein